MLPQRLSLTSCVRDIELHDCGKAVDAGKEDAEDATLMPAV